MAAGFNFRRTGAFVTDGTNERYILSSGGGDGPTNFPTNDTIDGESWSYGESLGNPQDRDRDAGGDARLAGAIYHNTGTTIETYTWTLPATGQREIRCAFGDAAFQITDDLFIKFYDDTTNFASINNTSVDTLAANGFYDATNVLRTTQSDWINNNAAITHTFTTTTFKIEINDAVSKAYCPICHVHISDVIGGGSTVKFRKTHSDLGTKVGTKQLQGKM
jgi:3-dehydroquinate dehydratase